MSLLRAAAGIALKFLPVAGHIALLAESEVIEVADTGT
jgi:hypothetical protein